MVFRTARFRLISGFVAISSTALLLSGCTSSSDSEQASPSTQVEREAAVGFKPNDSTCAPRGPSYTYKAGIRNNLPFAIRLDAGEYDCNDWSGVNTPGVAFTGKVLQPGEVLPFTLEPVKYTTRWWTLAVSPASGGSPFGTARLTMPQTSLGDVDRIEISGAQKIAVRIPGSIAYQCSLLQMSPTNAPTTPQSEYPDYFIYQTPLGVISYEGRVTLAGFCV
jgi:hypothetical protein